jgi:hypothetical protein
MRSVGLDLCGNVRARKKLRAVFESSKSLKKGSLQLGRGLQSSSTFRTQITHRLIHRQHVDSCPKTHYLVARRVKNPTCRVSGQKPNTSRIENSSAFLASVLLQHRSFPSPEPPLRMATVSQVENDRNGTGVAVLCCHLSKPGLEPRLATQELRMDATPQARVLLSRSCYTRRQSVVVLQDGTVGTVMVPK